MKINQRLKTVLSELSWTDRLLTLIIILSIVVGILISVYVPSARDKFDSDVQLAGVGIPLAVGLIVMMIPPLCKVPWESIHKTFLQDRSLHIQLLISVVLNWVVCPLVMFGLSWMVLFNEEEYRIGIIMIGLARCIAMVLVWNELAGGDNTLCSLIVVVNSIMQIVLYAPFQIFYCYVISGTERSGTVTYSQVAESVGAFLGIPFGIALLVRLLGVLVLGESTYQKRLIPFVSPWSLIALVYTIIVIFIERGYDFIREIGSAFKCFVPLVLYFPITWFGTFYLMRFLSSYVYRRKRRYNADDPEMTESLLCGCEKSLAMDNTRAKSKWCSADYGEVITQTFTAASNNFELSLAIAISVYGSGSKQSIAATFGPLIEVPVLLCLTIVARLFRQCYTWRDDQDGVNMECVVAK
ncbi:ARR3 [Cyberlindnera jadinii]|uniref:ARR3 protein n=1 Tax=Cyberlindnera jadinii (strain ATCC 18201 / CBS 1600 / BCRC 20928 / JCM 3617 / NBRC 0987 / NRRL Y-1542) TaxID=983966 RepID=A0A0H5C4M1_CYBJN|nr:ARR3 [Cyberlindnera jadinii]